MQPYAIPTEVKSLNELGYPSYYHIFKANKSQKHNSKPTFAGQPGQELAGMHSDTGAGNSWNYHVQAFYFIRKYY